MQGADELLTIAEIAVALIGFSGLISAFRARSLAELEARDLSALAMIIGSGAVAMVFALFPLPWLHFDLPVASVWAVSDAAFALVLSSAVAVIEVTNRRLEAAGHPARTPRLNRATQGIALLLAALLVASALGGLPRGPGIYLLALSTVLVLCLTFVGFLVVVSRRAGR